MKNRFRFLGLVAAVAIMGFGLAGCDNGGGGTDGFSITVTGMPSGTPAFHLYSRFCADGYTQHVGGSRYHGGGGGATGTVTFNIHTDVVLPTYLFGRLCPWGGGGGHDDVRFMPLRRITGSFQIDFDDLVPSHYTDDQGIVFLIETNGAFPVNGQDASGHVTIPALIHGTFPVRWTGQNTFENNTNITSVTIPASVTDIGSNAFYGTNLTSVTIPASVINIGSRAFSGNTNLATVVFEEGSRIQTINGFSHNTSLTSIAIPASVTDIGSDAFSNNTSLATVTFEEGSQLQTISGFAYNTSLTSITIPASVTDIGHWAFHGTNLTSVTIPAGVTNIGSSAFSGNTSLATVVFEEGSQLTTITGRTWMWSASRGAFENNTSLTAITIPASVTYIGSSAFYGNTSLATVTFEDGSRLSYIRHGAFTNNTSLTAITIPASVTYIGSSAFYGNTSLATVTFEDGSRLSHIYGAAFANNTSLTAITIPASVTLSGQAAFSGWTANQTIYIPHSTLEPAGWDPSWRNGNNARIYNNLTTPPTRLWPAP